MERGGQETLAGVPVLGKSLYGGIDSFLILSLCVQVCHTQRHSYNLGRPESQCRHSTIEKKKKKKKKKKK